MKKEESKLPTEKSLKKRKDFIGRAELMPYELKVKQLISHRLTDAENIQEVRNFVSSYKPSSEKYEAPKQRLLDEITTYESNLNK